MVSVKMNSHSFLPIHKHNKNRNGNTLEIKVEYYPKESTILEGDGNFFSQNSQTQRWILV